MTKRERSSVEGITWPALYAGETAVLAATLAQLAVSERLPAAALAERQGEQLALVTAHHARHTPSFQARLAQAGLGQAPFSRVADLNRLKPLLRRDVQTAGASFFAAHVPHGHLPLGHVKTSGATGEPVVVHKTAVNRLFWAALAMRDHIWNGRDFAGRMTAIRANLGSYSEEDNWGHPAAALYETGPGQGIPITTDVREQLRLVARFRPDILIVYPNNLDAFVEIWERDGFDLDSIRHIKALGETVSERLRMRVKAVTGLRVEDNYSSQEVGAIAIQCPVSELYHVMSETLVVEVLRPDGDPCSEGEAGRVVVTDLHNFASPMFRYDIGDYAEPGGPCPCGRGLPTLKRILGRGRNLIVKADGSRHWPLVGFHRYDEVAPVRQYQLIQHTISDIEFKVVTDAPLTGAQREALAAIAAGSLGGNVRVRITESRTRLPTGPNGKFEEFVSMVRPAET